VTERITFIVFQERIMRRFVLAAFALTVLVGCQPATTELTVEQKAEIAAEVSLRLNSFWDALKDADFDRIAVFIHQSPDLLMAADGAAFYGFATLESVYRPVVGSWASQELTVSNTNTVVLSPDVVYTMRVGTDAVTDTSGATGPTRPLIDTLVWGRHEGEWKIMFFHESHGAPTDH
jgi:hypothetical protein